ncbi:tyrosine-type recombinase/integrase [Frigoriglobus tundricola]|uniref:Tyr recombinase domain-containing protein n=1 Tax=Frigoriglobus tundricola TaxID=2774151 RepID=A0A6M5Z4C0_9BACT|nr:tyrosine-type recombinase/integrase [Frigoriglobus tundricola]QJX01258.1 hypothetical protein FTUN_8897 [Frigoriglobus tundricola]
MPRSPSVPSYRLHKPSGQAVVTIRTPGGDRHDVYLGAYNSPESRAEYGRLIAEQAAGPVAPSAGGRPTRATVDQILLLFLKHAEQHYRRSDGTLTDQVAEFKNALKALHRLYGHTAAAEFGPLALKVVRKAYIDAGNCRTLINSRVGKIKRVFRWAAEQELVPVTVYTALATVAGLQQGRTSARESEPVCPVDPATVDATLQHLNRHVAGLIRFQRLTGCRPGEAAELRRCDIDTSGAIWLFRPTQHKSKHKRKARVIAIGPKAQELLKAYFTADPTDYLFSPRRAKEEHNAARAANRKTPNYPSHVRHNAERKKAAPKRQPAVRYSRQAYLTAVTRACDRAKVERWHPNRLRHTFATELRRLHGIEAAQVALGHARADVTQVYAEKNLALAAKVAAEIG